MICDRYAFSGIAFSASKGLPYEWCRTPDISLPAPDLTLFLDISPEQAKERGGYGDERYEKEEMQRKVRQMFLRMGEEMSSGGRGRWVSIDAGRDMDSVADEIWTRVQEYVDGTDQPLQTLWVDQLKHSF